MLRSASRLVAALGFLAVACSFGGSADGGGVTSSTRTAPPTTAPAGAAQAADLRTHLDLLLGEHVMLIAKETAAAVNHSDEYAGYTSLLTANLTDLTDVMRSAFGNAAADDFSQAWTMQNNFLVDYGIGVVTHNDSRAQDAMTGLSSQFVTKFAAAINTMSGLPYDPIAQLATQQVLEDKIFIDDVQAQNYTGFYSDLLAAYSQTARLGDALSERIAQKFPDKFPGDPTVPRVDRRVSLNLLLQQHAFVATLATSAVVAKRDKEKTAASAALGLNADAISRSLNDLFGSSSSNAFDKSWTARDSGLLTYAEKGDSDSKKALTDTAPEFANAAHVQPGLANNQLTALIKVIDDQRNKSAKSVAGDDRAAATSMQPIADAVIASSKAG